MKWITRSHVHVDRVACPWLISRFIDSEAEFIYVPASQVEKRAKEEGAIPFDAPGLEFGHHGEDCTFTTLIKHFKLNDRSLLRMAKIVNAADTRKMESEPVAIGFEAIAVGYSVRYPKDHVNIEKQFEMYDALYAWCRLERAKEKGKAEAEGK